MARRNVHPRRESYHGLRPETAACARTAKDSEGLGENQLPGQGTRRPLKWPLDVGGNPPAVEIAGLRHYPLLVYPTLVHHAGIEREVVF
jgi:hypothetical protein